MKYKLGEKFITPSKIFIATIVNYSYQTLSYAIEFSYLQSKRKVEVVWCDEDYINGLVRTKDKQSNIPVWF